MRKLVKEILEIEQQGEILSDNFSYLGYHFWPLIRYEYLSAGLSSVYGISEVKTEAVYRQSFLKILKYGYLSFLKNPFRVTKKYEFIYFTAGTSNIRQGNYYLNRLADYYYSVLPENSVVIEDSFNYNYRRPRVINDLYYLDWIRIISKLRSVFRIKFSPDQKLQHTVRDFIQYLKLNAKHKISDKKYEELRALLLRRLYEKPILIRYYSKLIQKIAPRAIFVNGACYGSYPGVLVYVAKKMNVRVFEIQHGMISSEHIAYNFLIKDIDKYNQYLPECFLTFGKYWSEIINLPIKKIEIGHPYLEESLNLHVQEKKQIVLFISSSLSASSETKFILELKKKLDKLDCQLYFRIHPLDYDNYQQKYKILIEAGVLIDKDNLYKTLSIVKYVIGEVSTVLYEALLFNVLIMGIETDYSKGVNPQFVKIVKTADDVMEMINHPIEKEANVDYFWRKDWKNNFGYFISTMLNTKNES